MAFAQEAFYQSRAVVGDVERGICGDYKMHD